MNDWSATHYCSGGESGWTMYLDQSYTSEHHFHRQKEAKARIEEEEEDLSMVSDASSGPPHYSEDNEEWFSVNGHSSFASESATKYKDEKKKNKKKIKPHNRNQQHSYLDDTASSPVYGFSKKTNAASSNEVLKENAVDFSQGFSATHFKRKSAERKHFNFYGYEKSAPEE